MIFQVLLIGGSTGTMLEALHVVGDGHDGHDGSLGEVSFAENNLVISSAFFYFREYDYAATSVMIGELVTF